MFDFVKKIWHDPVWSKVIASIIFALFVALFRHSLSSCIPSYWWRAIRKKKPELHFVWHGSAGWEIGHLLQKHGGMERVLRIQGPVLVSSSNLEEPIIVTGIKLKSAEYVSPNFQMFEVKRGNTIYMTLLLNFRGVEPKTGVAFKANLTLIDIKGNRYPLKPAMLRAFHGEEISTTAS